MYETNRNLWHVLAQILSCLGIVVAFSLPLDTSPLPVLLALISGGTYMRFRQFAVLEETAQQTDLALELSKNFQGQRDLAISILQRSQDMDRTTYNDFLDELAELDKLQS